MTFSDVFKSNFLESAIEFSILDTLVTFAVALILALFIFLVYKKTYAGVMYSSAFGVSLVGMSVITAFIILAITSNVILSLGMVGALSIVRFRTAIKEPLDIVFLFWSISVGIVVGAGLIPLGVIGTIIIGIMILIFSTRKTNETPYIVVISCETDAAEKEIMAEIQSKTKKHLLKAKTVDKYGTELTIEVRLKDNTTDFVQDILKLQNVNNVSLVSYNGEYMS